MTEDRVISLLERYLDAADVVLLALDADGRISMINRKGCELLGVSKDELLGRRVGDTGFAPTGQGEFTEYLETRTGDDVLVVASPVLTRSGMRLLVEWRIRAIHDDDGKVIGTISSGTDIIHTKVARARGSCPSRHSRPASGGTSATTWDSYCS